MSQSYINVIGAGLAGSEAAYQIAERGIPVKLYEMRGVKSTPQHKTDNFAELVCSNSLRGDALTNAVGLLKEEMRRLGSVILESAEATRVPAGGALAVDRDGFSQMVTEKVANHPLIEVVRDEITELPTDVITVSMSSFFIQFVPVATLTEDPIINALFGGVVMGLGIGFALRNNISSGGTDIVSLTIRKKTGKNVGSISFLVNGTIMLIAGLTFGWKYALYSMITIFVSSRVTDAVFTKQKRMQAMIVTNHPEKVIEKIHKKLHRGATMIHDAEGTYNHERKAVLITVITRAEFNEFKQIMTQVDPGAFVSVSENVHILGRFVETEN